MTSNEYAIPFVMAHAISLQYNDHFTLLKIDFKVMQLYQKEEYLPFFWNTLLKDIYTLVT